MDFLNKVFLITTFGFLFLLKCVFPRSAGYARRARSDCYLPSGAQYERSMFIRVFSNDREPMSPGYRIGKGTRIQVVCKKDIQHDAILSSTGSRCIYGKWRPPLPDCIELKRCGNAPLIENAHASEAWQKSRTFPHDYVVTYRCEADLFLIGDNVIRCRDGVWTDEAFTCSEPSNPDRCRRLTVNNAEVRELSATRYNVTCNRGFELASDNTEFSCNNGEWIGDEPTCMPKVCPALGHVTYDVISSPLPYKNVLVYGSSIKVQCPIGQSAYRDVNVVECVEGNWKPFRPFCRRYCTIRQQYKFYSRLTHIGNGMSVKGQVNHGQLINQRCYGEPDVRRHRCFNGRWRPALKRCNPVDTAIPAPEYTNSLYKDFMDDFNQGCTLLQGNNFEFLSEDETVVYGDDDTINHGVTIKQVCKGDEDNFDKHHLVECNNGTWTPDLQACHNKDCQQYFDSSIMRTGQIKSPRGQAELLINSICSYHFHMGDSERVKIIFEELEIGGNDTYKNCAYNYLGYKSTATGGNVVKLCREKLPITIEEAGPDVALTIHTLRAKVVKFAAIFEFLTDEVKCLPPDNVQFQYKPEMHHYNINDTIKVSCQDDMKYVNGSDVWTCRADGRWNAQAECVKYKSCQCPELHGVTYDIGEEIGLFHGEIEHGQTAVVYKTCVGKNNQVDLNSYQMIECDDGILSDDIEACPEIRKEEIVSTCSTPSIAGITYSPMKDIYNKDESVQIIGCTDTLMLPVGAQQLTCGDDGTWTGSVQCLTFCENGVTYFQETEYSFFKRNNGVFYEQLRDIESEETCKDRCYEFEDFTCLSFEYRQSRNVCILTNKSPNDDEFTKVSGSRSAVIYERLCDDRCSIPSEIPESVIYSNPSTFKEYVPNQKINNGDAVMVFCGKTFTTIDITCMGGQWDKDVFDEFC